MDNYHYHMLQLNKHCPHHAIYAVLNLLDRTDPNEKKPFGFGLNKKNHHVKVEKKLEIPKPASETLFNIDKKQTTTDGMTSYQCNLLNPLNDSIKHDDLQTNQSQDIVSPRLLYGKYQFYQKIENQLLLPLNTSIPPPHLKNDFDKRHHDYHLFHTHIHNDPMLFDMTIPLTTYFKIADLGRYFIFLMAIFTPKVILNALMDTLICSKIQYRTVPIQIALRRSYLVYEFLVYCLGLGGSLSSSILRPITCYGQFYTDPDHTTTNLSRVSLNPTMSYNDIQLWTLNHSYHHGDSIDNHKHPITNTFHLEENQSVDYFNHQIHSYTFPIHSLLKDNRQVQSDSHNVYNRQSNYTFTLDETIHILAHMISIEYGIRVQQLFVANPSSRKRLLCCHDDQRSCCAAYRLVTIHSFRKKKKQKKHLSTILIYPHRSIRLDYHDNFNGVYYKNNLKKKSFLTTLRYKTIRKPTVCRSIHYTLYQIEKTLLRTTKQYEFKRTRQYIESNPPRVSSLLLFQLNNLHTIDRRVTKKIDSQMYHTLKSNVLSSSDLNDLTHENEFELLPQISSYSSQIHKNPYTVSHNYHLPSISDHSQSTYYHREAINNQSMSTFIGCLLEEKDSLVRQLILGLYSISNNKIHFDYGQQHSLHICRLLDIFYHLYTEHTFMTLLIEIHGIEYLSHSLHLPGVIDFFLRIVSSTTFPNHCVVTPPILLQYLTSIQWGHLLMTVLTPEHTIKRRDWDISCRLYSWRGIFSKYLIQYLGLSSVYYQWFKCVCSIPHDTHKGYQSLSSLTMDNVYTTHMQRYSFKDDDTHHFNQRYNHHYFFKTIQCIQHLLQNHWKYVLSIKKSPPLILKKHRCQTVSTHTLQFKKKKHIYYFKKKKFTCPIYVKQSSMLSNNYQQIFYTSTTSYTSLLHDKTIGVVFNQFLYGLLLSYPQPYRHLPHMSSYLFKNKSVIELMTFYYKSLFKKTDSHWIMWLAHFGIWCSTTTCYRWTGLFLLILLSFYLYIFHSLQFKLNNCDMLFSIRQSIQKKTNRHPFSHSKKMNKDSQMIPQRRRRTGSVDSIYDPTYVSLDNTQTSQFWDMIKECERIIHQAINQEKTKKCVDVKQKQISYKKRVYHQFLHFTRKKKCLKDDVHYPQQLSIESHAVIYMIQHHHCLKPTCHACHLRDLLFLVSRYAIQEFFIQQTHVTTSNQSILTAYHSIKTLQFFKKSMIHVKSNGNHLMYSPIQLSSQFKSQFFNHSTHVSPLYLSQEYTSCVTNSLCRNNLHPSVGFTHVAELFLRLLENATRPQYVPVSSNHIPLSSPKSSLFLSSSLPESSTPLLHHPVPLMYSESESQLSIPSTHNTTLHLDKTVQQQPQTDHLIDTNKQSQLIDIAPLRDLLQLIFVRKEFVRAICHGLLCPKYEELASDVIISMIQNMCPGRPLSNYSFYLGCLFCEYISIFCNNIINTIPNDLYWIIDTTHLSKLSITSITSSSLGSTASSVSLLNDSHYDTVDHSRSKTCHLKLSTLNILESLKLLMYLNPLQIIPQISLETWTGLAYIFVEKKINSIFTSRCYAIYQHILSYGTSDIIETAFLKSHLIYRVVFCLFSEFISPDDMDDVNRYSYYCRGEFGAILEFALLLHHIWLQYSQSKKKSVSMMPHPSESQCSLLDSDTLHSTKNSSYPFVEFIRESVSPFNLNGTYQWTDQITSSVDLNPLSQRGYPTSVNSLLQDTTNTDPNDSLMSLYTNRPEIDATTLKTEVISNHILSDTHLNSSSYYPIQNHPMYSPYHITNQPYSSSHNPTPIIDSQHILEYCSSTSNSNSRMSDNVLLCSTPLTNELNTDMMSNNVSDPNKSKVVFPVHTSRIQQHLEHSFCSSKHDQYIFPQNSLNHTEINHACSYHLFKSQDEPPIMSSVDLSTSMLETRSSNNTLLTQQPVISQIASSTPTMYHPTVCNNVTTQSIDYTERRFEILYTYLNTLSFWKSLTDTLSYIQEQRQVTLTNVIPLEETKKLRENRKLEERLLQLERQQSIQKETIDLSQEQLHNKKNSRIFCNTKEEKQKGNTMIEDISTVF